MSYSETNTMSPDDEKEYFKRIHEKREQLGLPSLLHLLTYERFMKPNSEMPQDLTGKLDGIEDEADRSEVILDYLRAKRDYELFNL